MFEVKAYQTKRSLPGAVRCPDGAQPMKDNHMMSTINGAECLSAGRVYVFSGC